MANLSIDALWVRGRFQDSYLAESDTASLRWRTAFIQSYLESDIPALGPIHALLGLPSAEQILSNMISGPSWEGFAVENILSAVPSGTQSYYYRTGAGAEIDLVLDLSSSTASSRDRHKPWAIEIKRSSTPSVSRGFHIGSADIQAKRKLVVYPGAGSFSLGQGIEA